VGEDIPPRSRIYRILAPNKDTAFAPGRQYQNYFNGCTSSLGYNVSTSDVFGCAGALACNAALCGALNRYVAQLPTPATRNFRPTAAPASGTATPSGTRPTASRRRRRSQPVQLRRSQQPAIPAHRRRLEGPVSGRPSQT
jgi:hypothetical protein